MSASGLAVIAELGDFVGVDILNPLAGDWMILSNDGTPAIVPDTVPRFEYRNETRVSDYPLEQGAFASFNKVQTPFDIRMTMVCAGLNYAQSASKSIKDALNLSVGQDLMNRPDFLTTLDYMLDTTDLFSIVTPDKTYTQTSLVHYDYRRETNDGAVMLKIEAWFREIRVTGSATYSSSGNAGVKSNSPSASSPVGLGTVHAGDSVTVTAIGGEPVQ